MNSNHHIELPELTGEQAFLLVEILEQIVFSIWSHHEAQMADFHSQVFPDWTSARFSHEPPPDDEEYIEEIDLPY